VDDQHISMVRPPQDREYAQLLSNFGVEHPSENLVVGVMNMQSLINKLNKMSISNIIIRQ
jgi:hypothetical protein